MSGAQPLVSVVIPVYNTAAYLPRVIESVLKQTRTDWELILVNDGSTDDSGAVCDRYALLDPRIRAVHTENEGSSAARNVGMALAHGEWLLFIDSDDWIVENALETLLAHSGDADVVVGHYPGQQAPWRTVSEPRTFLLDRLSQEDMSELFYLRMFYPVWNKLFRRERVIDLFREDLSYGEDAAFMIANYARWRQVVFLPDDTYCYAQRPDSLTYAFRIDRMEQVRTNLRLFSGMFPDGSDVMNTLSRWYALELRLYLSYYVGNPDMPREVRELMLKLWLEDGTFDHSRISTALLTRELVDFWHAVMDRDISALLDILQDHWDAARIRDE